MSDLNKNNFICNSTDCYLNNEKYLANNNVDTCKLCSFRNENLEQIKEEIQKEFLNKRQIKYNQYKTRFIEYTIGVGAGALFVTYVLHFINKIITNG